MEHDVAYQYNVFSASLAYPKASRHLLGGIGFHF